MRSTFIRLILWIYDIVFQTRLMKTVSYFNKLSLKSSSEVQALSELALEKILRYTVNNSKYYSNVDLSSTDNAYENLSRFPVLSKKDLNRYSQDLLVRSSKSLIVNKSSGSTGVRTVTYQNRKEQSIVRGIQLFWWFQFGYNLGDRIIQTGINFPRSFPKRIKDVLLRVQYISAFSYNESQILKIFRKLENYNSVCVVGYASSLNAINKTIVENNIRTQTITTAISLGDTLYPQYRSSIKWGQIYDTYGCSEGVLIAAQLDGQYYYVMNTHVHIEILDCNNNPVKDGEMGEITITRLDNYTQPLIRYKLGDLGILLPLKEYPDKRAYPFQILKEICGRTGDVIKSTKGGTHVVHAFTGVFEHISEIIQWQIEQEKIDEMKIRYIGKNKLALDKLGDIEQRLLSFLGEEFKINWEMVPEILPSPSGKPRLIISRLNNS